MKKATRLLITVVITGLAVYGIHVLVVLTSKGTSEIRYIEPEGPYNSFSDILQHPDLKGKVVYVDYWHTGCSPCLKEFEHMPKLKAIFSGNKDLAFLYLGKDRSVPGEKYRWKKMIEKKNLYGSHFFMTDEFYDIIWDETVNDSSVLKAFPHYLIVDRDGNILNNHAPRPSNEILIAELKNALSR